MLSPCRLQPPRPAALLGASGLLPAIAALVALLWGPVEWRGVATHALAAYAAIILSFLGGAWWGLGTGAEDSARPPLAAVLAVSVLPSLAGWAALLVDRVAGLTMLGLLFLVVLPGDAWLTRARLAPAWWPRLRVPLSLGMAALSLVAAAAAAHH
ncbi:MAG: DUF3429 domain-containing protein [Sphingomonadaceae bacterium]